MGSIETLSQLETDYERTVRDDIEAFRKHAEDFLAQRITDDEFRGFRLRRGVYGQRQPGVHMVRTKIPGGQLLAHQIEKLADAADEFASGKGHFTTRQNMQFHFIPTRRAADLLHRLADARLTTREACYNTVRNVTGSPLAGLLENEVFDVRPYMQRVALAFLHNTLTDSMPRKFKICFSGSPEEDVALGIHDLGFLAQIRDGKRGFRLVAAGGLGPLPVESQLLDEFLPEERIVQRSEAVIRVFNRWGNRQNRNKARLKFVIRERGWDWFKEKVEEEYADILANGGTPIPEEVPEGFGGFQSQPQAPADGSLLPVLDTGVDAEYERWVRTNVRKQRQAGYRIVNIKTDQGNLVSSQMRLLAEIARTSGDGVIRVGIDQNLSLAYIPEYRLKQVYSLLRRHDLGEAGIGELDDPVTCPGAYSCNLALTKTMNLGAALSSAMKEYLRANPDEEISKLRIHASGCPNACGQHWTGDLGFYGNARKIGGREVPYYMMLLGGGTDGSGAARFGLAIQSLPARHVPIAAARVLDHYRENRQPGERFRDYVVRCKVQTFKELTADLVKPSDLSPEMYRDWGDDVDFSVQLGRGECAA